MTIVFLRVPRLNMYESFSEITNMVKQFKDLITCELCPEYHGYLEWINQLAKKIVYSRHLVLPATSA